MQSGQPSALSSMTVLDYLEHRICGFGDDLRSLGKLTLTEVEDRLNQIDTHGELSVSLDDDPIRRDDVFTCLVYGQYMNDPEALSDLPIQNLFDYGPLNSQVGAIVSRHHSDLSALLAELSDQANTNVISARNEQINPENAHIA